LAYFRAEFVERRRWLDDHRYSDLVALCQFLPGPASSQVGMALGLGRAGWWGALAAWFGFTLPSAIVLMLFAFGVSHWADGRWAGALHGLQVMTVAVVAQAVWGMSKSFCTDRLRAAIALAAVLVTVLWSSALSQVLVIAVGAVLGWRFLTSPHRTSVEHRDPAVDRFTAVVLLLIFASLLIGLPLASGLMDSAMLAAFSDFYQAGALVFGGGHVVLPLLQSTVVASGAVSNDLFLAGYGAAQAVPGPLFTFAAYLGAVMPAPLGGWTGGLLTLLAIFLPSFLLVAGALPFWEILRQREAIARAMGGINAAVVGILGAALYDLGWTHAAGSRADVLLVLMAYGLLVFGKVSPVWVACMAALAGVVLG
jgi:chromate transporter